MYLKYNNLRFKATYANAGSFYSVCLANCYWPLISQIKKDDIVVDGGANIGTFSIIASRVAERVIAIEPDPHNYAMLLENIELNNASNIVAINAALSNHTGSGYFEGNGENGHLSTRGIKVRLATIDEVSSCRATIVKLDIEGAEPLALMSQGSLDSIRAIAFELDVNQYDNIKRSNFSIPDEYTYENLIRVLSDKGFDVEFDPYEDNFHYRNFITKDVFLCEIKTGLIGTRFLLKWFFGGIKPANLFSMVFATRHKYQL